MDEIMEGNIRNILEEVRLDIIRKGENDGRQDTD
jgi:hypothetical protein